MGFSRQECWGGLPCLPPGQLPRPGMEPASLASPALAGVLFTTSATWGVAPQLGVCVCVCVCVCVSNKISHFCLKKLQISEQN